MTSLSKWHMFFLVLCAVFLVSAWVFGGQAGYTNPLGTTLPWITAILATLWEGFKELVGRNGRRKDLTLVLADLLMYELGLVPISWLTVHGFVVASMLGPVGVVIYVLFGLHLLSTKITKPTTRSSASPKGARPEGVLHTTFGGWWLS